MRSWIFGNKDENKAQDPPTADGNGTATTNATGGSTAAPARFPGSSHRGPLSGGPGAPKNVAVNRRGSAAEVGFMSAFQSMARGGFAQDAEMERRVSIAARNLGDGVLKIVMAAKESGRQQGASQSEWKGQLLDLLGGADSTENDSDEADIDVLLENSKCDKFVLRCVENELPPNLIHCLRLLRVMELQHANVQKQAGGTMDSISKNATSKVSRLLCLLCKDSSVGEQLRPHLFGLLALSGASYPPSGVHVGTAASAVIVAFSEHCLSTSLVWFLHDRKMIVHMVDDVKELCGMTEVTASSTASVCLYGEDAEKAGLWGVALRAVVYLVVFSCNHQCLELLNDFDAAGGYHVLLHAIKKSTSHHAKMLMELVTTLACCTTEIDPPSPLGDPDDKEGQPAPDQDQKQDKQDAKLVTNPAAFDVIEDLMVSSMPLLKEYERVHGGERPDLSSEESLQELATFSLRTALTVRFTEKSESDDSDQFDLAMELLVTTLQMYSDHAGNYAIVEEKHSILSYYLLAFPTFEDVSLKVLILKTLEYVCTGVAGTDAVRPLMVTNEIFFALCKSLLKGTNGSETDSEEETKIYEELLMDADMMCATIEKLLEFDDRVSEVMLDGGVLTTKLNDVLDLVSQVTETAALNKNSAFEADGKKYSQPPSSTPLDRVFAAICRVLKLVVIQQFATSSPRSAVPSSSGDSMDEDTASSESQLHSLLFTAMKELGDEASAAALGVFDAMMGEQISPELLEKDMEFVMEVLDYFAEMTRLGSHNRSLTKKSSRSDRGVNGSKKSKAGRIKPRTVLREADVFAMLRSALEVNGVAQDAFRTSGGFEYIVQITLCLEGYANLDSSTGKKKDGKTKRSKHGSKAGTDCDDRAAAIIKLLESAFGLLSASVGASRKTGKGTGAELSLSSRAMEVLNEDSVAQLSGPTAKNRQYLHRKGFYVDFVNAISSTGIFSNARYTFSVVNLALSYMDVSLQLSDDSVENEIRGPPKSNQIQVVRNPDASRFVMGLATCLPQAEYGVALSKRALDEMLRLCTPEMAGATLTQMSSCGLCSSITNRHEFGPLLEDRSHHLYSRFVLLLRRIAAFSMSYTDFVALLRGIAGPMLMTDNKDAPNHLRNRIRLPVISSVVTTNTTYSQKPQDAASAELWEAREADFCTNLETLCIIAERGDNTPHCRMGGDSLEGITQYMQETIIEDRLYSLAEEGTLDFLEIKSIDAYALTSSGSSTAGTPSPSNAAERIWTPLAASGFSYSIWLRLSDHDGDASTGRVFILDLSSPPEDSTAPGGAPNSSSQGGSNQVFMSLWFNLQKQQFCVLTSASHRNEPTSFPVSPLKSGVWHHVLLAYIPPKRSMLSRKAVLEMFVDGRPLEAEVRVDSVNLPPNSRVRVGTPNPFLASSGIVHGPLPHWDLGPALMLSTLVANRDATSIFTAGPSFQGLFWGDRPQRLSLTATATAAFAMLAESGEQGSVAGALRRRQVPEVEAAGHVIPERGFGGGRVQGPEADSLGAVGLLCTISPDHFVFGFLAASSSGSMRDGLSPSNRRNFSRRLVNVARMNASNETVSTDAIVYGVGSVVSPHSFADNVQWIGGPNVLLPIVNAARSTRSLALALRLIRESVHRHPPNLEMLQAGGGFRMLGALLRQKRIMDERVLDECFAFAVHGFDPISAAEHASPDEHVGSGPLQSWPSSNKWVFSDLDAMKYLLLNHQVWDMRGSGPALPLRLLSFFNCLVAQQSTHKAFNSRRLHLLGIVHWTLHLMLEAAELYTAGEVAAAADASDENTRSVPAAATAAFSNGWYVRAPSVECTSIGGDPDNTMLLACKTLLRRVLTFMLTPGDLEAIAEAAIYTVSITGPSTKVSGADRHKIMAKGRKLEGPEVKEDRLLPAPVARVYLIRLIEELVVDGVNEIVSAGSDKKGSQENDVPSEPSIEPHAGGGSSTNQSYFTSMMTRTRKGPDGSIVDDFSLHPKHQQAQAFLQAFGGVLTPVWFACLLEGCHEEASASAVLRLMVLMLQSSPAFAAAFDDAGGFAPLVLSIPKFSTCPSIIMSMLSQLLHAPILHLPCFGVLDATQVCDVFASESDAAGLVKKDHIQGGNRSKSDPSCGIFALLAECLGRNIQLAPFSNALGRKARQTNEAVLQLLSHQHKFSSEFQHFCRTPDFLEPLAQALCLVHDEKLQRMQQNFDGGTIISEVFNPHEVRSGGHTRTKRRGSLADMPRHETPTERFVGRPEEVTGSSGIGMVHLLRLVVSHAVMSGPLAAPLISALFRSFPIHASPDQVEAFHLVMIEHCRSVVDDALLCGEPIAFANCIGLSSVLLDRLMAGFYTSEPALETVNIILSVLTTLTTSDSYASRVLSNADLNILTVDAAHIARLTCLTALQRSRPLSPYDEGDEDLKIALLDIINKHIQSLLLVPAVPQSSRRQAKLGGGATQAYPPPPTTSRVYPLWLSASLSRSFVACAYTDLSAMPRPDRAFTVALMDEMYALLFDMREDMRDTAVSIIVALLQQKREIMSEILIAESTRGDRMETIDVMNRGGFGALLVAHEAATIAENVSTVPRRGSGGRAPVSKSKYASFFEWLERNQPQVEAVFNGIHMESRRLFPGAEMGAATPEEAIENEQKSMLLKLTSQESSDRTILGGLERAELAQRCYGKTADNHDLWMRQGFDDLSSGAMQWKFLLRQLKGSCSIWEGGALFDHESSLYKKALLADGNSSQKAIDDDGYDNKTLAKLEMVKRWKLDLTEGYERQRRRFLPNYEFHSLYNLDEMADHAADNEAIVTPMKDNEGAGSDADSLGSEGFSSHLANGPQTTVVTPGQRRESMFGPGPGESMEATAALLKDLNLKRGSRRYNDDFYDTIDEDMEFDDAETATTAMSSDQDDSPSVSESVTTKDTPVSESSNLRDGGVQKEDELSRDEKEEKEKVSASSYDLITGLLQAGDWPEKSYNVNRCTGLEVRKGLLLWCREALYIVDGFEQTDGDGLEGYIKRLEKESSTFNINLRPQDFKASEEGEEGYDSFNHGDADGKGGAAANRNKVKATENSSEEITYQHRSQRIAFNDLYSVFRRKYQLQGNALEFFDVHRNGTLVAFSSKTEREQVLSQILITPLPNSIFKTTGYGSSINYKKFMNQWKNKIVSQWVSGKMTNFDFLMHLNSFAGRTYNDLTQYPVFPWVIADYKSEEIDLNDPATFRDLSKPMGAQGETRAQQFRDRYEALASTYFGEDEPPPFHYGTHYSTSAYVLYYLMRLEPFSRLALSLQGGRFDVADRLFHNVAHSWSSASAENLQDVRELIPEFFYFPDFLVNSNLFDFGTTQMGKTVHDVTLPPWAKGDPKRFVRINRQALESDYVSKNLQGWCDLIFGCKQRGEDAVEALNMFVHVTYEGEVDLETMDDPIQRESTIAQIQNFGQTPSRIERKPFPQRIVQNPMKDKSIDFGSLTTFAPLTPPFCVVGAPHLVGIRAASTDTCKVGMAGQTDSAVGDMYLVKGQIIGVGRTCALILPEKKYYRFGGPNNGVSIHVASTTTRHREVDKLLSIHDGMHRAPISCARVSRNGMWLVTGCMDSTVRVWRHDQNNVELRATLCGHEGGQVTCIDVSTVFGTIATGCARGTVLLWDLRTLTFLRRLRHPFTETTKSAPGADSRYPAVSVSINHKNGNVVTLLGAHLSIFDINGNFLASQGPGQDFGTDQDRPSCATATDCPEWMENGIVAVTGHMTGDIRLWSLDYDNEKLVMRHLMADNPHSCPITALRPEGDRHDTLLVGDKSGRMSVCKTQTLENLNPKQLSKVVDVLRSGIASGITRRDSASKAM